MKPLGPLASLQEGETNPTYMLFVDLTDRLGQDETITDALMNCDVAGVVLTEVAPIDVQYAVWWSGKILGVGKAVRFRVTFTEEMEMKVPTSLTITTDGGNIDVLEVPLKVYVRVP